MEEVEKMKGRSNSWWNNLISGKQGMVPTGQIPTKLDIPTTDEIFKMETEILEGIAETSSCVITGRSGFYVFRNEPNHLSVLIQASMPHRIERVMRKQNMTEDEARKTIEKIDKMRENYVQKFTKTSRYDTRNYETNRKRHPFGCLFLFRVNVISLPKYHWFPAVLQSYDISSDC